MTIASCLEAGLEGLRNGPAGLALPEGAAPKLLELLNLLEKWNRTYNLTAIRDTQRMVSHHILDSLTVTTFIREPGKILDVGTGAGLPGLPIAVARPDCRVTLVDANSKKTAFCEHARIALALPNVEVITERVEAFHAPVQFDYVVSRAFSDLATFVDLASKHVAEGGIMLAMKGITPDQEMHDLPSGWGARSESVHVPGLEGKRCVVVLTRESTVGSP